MLLGKCFRPRITVTLSCTRRRGAQNKWRMKRAGLNKVGVQYDRHGGVKEMWWEKDCFAVMTDPVMVGLWFTQVHVGTFFKASAAYCDSDVLIWVSPPPLPFTGLNTTNVSKAHSTTSVFFLPGFVSQVSCIVPNCLFLGIWKEERKNRNWKVLQPHPTIVRAVLLRQPASHVNIKTWRTPSPR